MIGLLMDQIYLCNPKEPARKRSRVGRRIAGGAAGDIHLLPDFPGQVLKLYKDQSDRKIYAPKLKAMVEQQPKLPSMKPIYKNFQQLAWPVSIAESKRGEFLGFSMPEINFEGSFSLERMLQKRIREAAGLPKYYGYRFSVAHNLALSVAALHKSGHHIIDLKPNNCRIHPTKMFISILDCDGFSINAGHGKRFYAKQYTPEYIAPEASQENPDTLGEEQDLFALAVIIFKLLNNGLHPFQSRLPKGVEPQPLQQMINARLYAYSVNNKSKYLPAIQSIHECFPNELRKMFDQAFLSSVRPKAAKWRDVLRKYADPSTGNLIRCSSKPDEHAYFDEDSGCGWCELDNKIRRSIANKPRPSNAKYSARPKSRKPQLTAQTTNKLLSNLSKVQGRFVSFLVIISALYLLFR